jgi:hypothetical protein
MSEVLDRLENFKLPFIRGKVRSYQKAGYFPRSRITPAEFAAADGVYGFDFMTLT